VRLSQSGPRDGLRSMAILDRLGESIRADSSALEQIRFYGDSLARLRWTRVEASAISALFGESATLLLDKNATIPRLREEIEKVPPRVLHLATHGLLGSAARPLLASLALTTPQTASVNDTGFLTLEEILSTWGTQLRNTDMVVLSACETGQGIRQGDTMMALPLGLFIAGARTVVASLWKVDDRATALLMARFYANWLGKTNSEREVDGNKYFHGQAMPKLAALREAQAWLRSLTAAELEPLAGADGQAIALEAVRGEPLPRRAPIAIAATPVLHPYDHPYYWAAFVLYGRPE